METSAKTAMNVEELFSTIGVSMCVCGWLAACIFIISVILVTFTDTLLISSWQYSQI